MDNKDKRQQLNNKGFSLVELIVIMVLMVIMATAVVVSFVNSGGQKVKASTTVVTNYLRDVLNYNMTKGTSYMTIRYDADKDVYYVEDNQGHSEKLASGISISYNLENSSEEDAIAINEQKPTLMLSFSRANGAFSHIVTGVNGDGSLAYSDSYAEYINIKSNGSEKRIHMYVKTGEYEVEDV